MTTHIVTAASRHVVVAPVQRPVAATNTTDRPSTSINSETSFALTASLAATAFLSCAQRRKESSCSVGGGGLKAKQPAGGGGADPIDQISQKTRNYLIYRIRSNSIN